MIHLKRAEQDIMKTWNSQKSPVVSVCCATYNHENYVSEAINSFLMQETDFPFEIIIRDDCSTDKTAMIIRAYVEKYPNIIKPIYETENHYSKGIIPMPVIFKKAVGEYFALCDGDDYWTDKGKLQIQIDEMEKYPEVDICFHYASELRRNKKGKDFAKRANMKKVFTTSEVILGDGEFCPTASLVLRQEVIKTLPDWFYKFAPVGDYFIQIFGSLRGGALYINRNMSIYRIMVPDSWTVVTENIEKRLVFIERFVRSLNFLKDDYGRYQYEIEQVITYHCLGVLKDKGLGRRIKIDFYKKHKTQLSVKERLFWLLIYRNPTVHKSISGIKRTIQNWV